MARLASIPHVLPDFGLHPDRAVPVDAEFEARWRAWKARSAAHERAVRRKLLILTPALALAAVIVYVLLAR